MKRVEDFCECKAARGQLAEAMAGDDDSALVEQRCEERDHLKNGDFRLFVEFNKQPPVVNGRRAPHTQAADWQQT